MENPIDKFEIEENLTSGKTLIDFVAYCKANPKERFWQAMKNFIETDFIFLGSMNSKEGGEVVNLNGMKIRLRDTYYFTEKNK